MRYYTSCVTLLSQKQSIMLELKLQVITFNSNQCWIHCKSFLAIESISYVVFCQISVTRSQRTYKSFLSTLLVTELEFLQPSYSLFFLYYGGGRRLTLGMMLPIELDEDMLGLSRFSMCYKLIRFATLSFFPYISIMPLKCKAAQW